MQLVLDVVSSVSIKRRKPWPRLAWLGQEHDALYLLDKKQISQLYIPSGKTKKKISKLHSLMDDICAINVSQNGQYLCGALFDGKIFLWNRDMDKLQFITGLPKLFNDADRGNPKNKIFLSSCGTMVLLMVGFKKLFLWQKNEKAVSGEGEGITGTWAQIHHGDYVLPGQSNIETSVDGVFYTDHVVGRCGALSYVFTAGTNLTITTLIIKWHGQTSITNPSHNLPNQDDETVPREVTENVKCSIKWRSLSRPLYGITPATRLVKGKFVYVSRHSPDGQMLAIVLNQKSAKDTRLMYYSHLHATTTIANLNCCGGSDESSGRVWWVSDIAWTQDSLLLIGVTRNGALFITSKLGEAISLVASGCLMEMGPSLFLPLHPRITARSFQENIPPDCSEISSGSEKDVFHQKFSVAVHPKLPLCVCSDGYVVTILQFNDKPGHAEMIARLIEEVSFLLPKGDHPAIPVVCNHLKKKPQDLSTTTLSSVWASSENISTGSSSSETTHGYGMAKNLETGLLTFGDTDGKARSDVEQEVTKQQKHSRAKNLLLQALGIGTTCGPHWSRNMSVTMNMVIHTWGKLFWFLLKDESNSTSLSGKNIPFVHITKLVQSALEIFHWDMAYQNCLPWFSEMASSVIKFLVTSKIFGHKEIIDVCLRLLHMAEASVNNIYAWRAASNRSSVHLLGDIISPLCDVVFVPTTGDANFSRNPRTAALQTNNNLDCKLQRSWLILYNYICRIYRSRESSRSDDEKDQIPDQQLVKGLCVVQNKLQEIISPRILVTLSKMDSPFDQGRKLYLEGKSSHAVCLLKKSFDDRKNNLSEQPLKTNLKSSEEISAESMVETSVVSGIGSASLVEQDLSIQLKRDTDTLLAILHMNLENYDLKGALALVYSFIEMNRPIHLQYLLNTGARLGESPPIFPVDESREKVTSSTSLAVLHLSQFQRYPLAWVVDNCGVPVVQQLARFMSCYFTNLPLTVPLPFQPGWSALYSEQSDVKQPGRSATANVKNLSQQRVTEAISESKLEAFWTADHALELLVVSGLLSEAAWFANRLGDWKTAFVLSVADEQHRMIRTDFYRVSSARLYFPSTIEMAQPNHLMMTSLKWILHLEDDLVSGVLGDQSFISDESVISVLQNALKASVIAGLDLVPVVIEYLVNTLQEKISDLAWMVPQELYLPAPPLYCPQPTRNEEEILDDEMRKETKLRGEIANVVQKILAIYRGSNSFLLCAQEYCKHLASERDVLPTVIKEFVSADRLFSDSGLHNGKAGEFSPNCGDSYPESVVKVIKSFQKFCTLMWLLHVRDEVALSSRAYRKVKQGLFEEDKIHKMTDIYRINRSKVLRDGMDQDEDHSQIVILKCEEALTWLRRLLPFSTFLDAAPQILDGLLTLLAELPLTIETVSMLAQYFYTTSSSLSLSTAEKFKRLTRRLRNFRGPMGMGNGDPLSAVFQERCEELRKKDKEIPENRLEKHPSHFETAFEFSNSLSYQEDSAYLRFLDTFLLITVSKNITERDHQAVPLILPYKKQLELVEISPYDRQKESDARACKPVTHTSVAIQRSKSFQDVSRKAHGPLPFPDCDKKDKRSRHRSNSLTDLQRVHKSKLSEKLLAMLPRLVWLRKWCSVEEGHKANANHPVIRVQAPLSMIVNTLWLLENYYKDFVEAKGRCVKAKSPRMWRRNGTKGNSDNAKKPGKKGKGEGRGGRREREPVEGKKVDTCEMGQVSGEIEPAEVIQPVVIGSLGKDQPVSDRSLKKYHKRRSKMNIITEQTTNEDASRRIVNKDREQPSMKDFDGGVVDGPTASKNENFSSSLLSFVDSKSKLLEPVKEELPLLSLPVLDYSLTTSGDKSNSKNNNSQEVLPLNSPRIVRTTDPESSVESGILSSHQLNFTEESELLSSESLSVGQIRSDIVGLVEPTKVGNTSIKTEQTGEAVKTRKPAKRRIREESSSSEMSGKFSTQSTDEASLLRRIIRSEMRKFIKLQHAEPKPQSSAVETTEDEVFSKNLSTVEESSAFARKRKLEAKDPKKPAPDRVKNLSSSSREKTTVVDIHKETSNSCKESSQGQLPNENQDKPADDLTYGLVGETNYSTSNYPSSLPGQPLIKEHQIPAAPMNRWPVWYQAPFPVAPAWVWPNSPAKMSDEKGIQVSSESPPVLSKKESRQEDDSMKLSKREKERNKEYTNVVVEAHSPPLQNKEPSSRKYRTETNHVAVQTDTETECQESKSKKKIRKESDHVQQDPSLLSLRSTEDKDIKVNVEEIRTGVGISEEQLTLDNARERRNAENVSSDQLSGKNDEETTKNRNVIQEILPCHSEDVKGDGDISQEGSTIPLLRIPPEITSCTSSVLPFKIAWPDELADADAITQKPEIPLLRLDDMERSDTECFTAVAAPVTNERSSEAFPLLHLLDSTCQDPSLRNFRFVEVTQNQNLELPFLHLPEAEKHLSSSVAKMNVEVYERTAPKKKSRSDDKKQTEAPQTRDKTSNARMKRRHRLKESASYAPPTINSKQQRKSAFLKQSSSQSPSSGVEPCGSVITVQGTEKTTPSDGITSKKRPTRRREKLRELNNIIRDLQREISDESDLVLSEVSELLSEEIQYENFGKKLNKRIERNKVTVAEERATRAETSKNKNNVTNKEFGFQFRSSSKSFNIPRHVEPSVVSAHDIHSEFSSNLPEQPLSSDAKVGTVRILQLPASIQTDAVLQPPETFINLPKSRSTSEMQEHGVQTDMKEVTRQNLHRNVRDTGINTENISLMKQDSADESAYPRLPPDVYLNLNFERNSTGQRSQSTPEDRKTDTVVEEEGQRRFISVADIGPDVVKRRIQEKSEILSSNSVQKKYLDDDTEKDIKGDEPPAVSPIVQIDTNYEVTLADDVIHEGDPTTADVLSPADLHLSRVHPVTFCVSPEKEAQKISKDRLSQRLQEMNEQFEVIERITSNMDRDLQRSNMLLRTIDNLNQVTDHVPPPEIQTQDIAIRAEILNDQGKRARADLPWTNKPIEQLTELVYKEEAEVKNTYSPDSVESDNDGAGVKAIQDNHGNKDIVEEIQHEIGSNRQRRKTSTSSVDSECGPSKDTKELLDVTTTWNDAPSSRGATSVIQHDKRNLSGFQDLLVSPISSTVADSRIRDKTPQRKYELKEWMSKKRKMRHEEWAAKLNEQRQAEHKPFLSKTQGDEAAMSSKKIKKVQKERKDNRSAQKKENMEERLMSAYDLVTEMIAEPVPKAPVITRISTLSTPKKGKKVARVRPNNRYRDSRSGKSKRTKRATKGTNSDESYRQKNENARTGLSGRDHLGTSPPNLIQDKNAPVYKYDIEQSGRRFITRNSYEQYQARKSSSYDLERSISFGRVEPFQHSLDSRVDKLLDDVSVSGTLEAAELDNVASLLSGDSELRELLNDVITEKDGPRPELHSRNDDVISVVSSNGFTANSDRKWKTRKPADSKRTMLGTFEVPAQYDREQERRNSDKSVLPDTESETINHWHDADNFEMSDEVAALIAEAKAAVGDDFSGTSETGDIDWNEVDNILQES